MGKFVARIMPDYEFSQARMELLGAHWEELKKEIMETDIGTEMVMYRFTFAVYVLEAETRDRCREILSQAFANVFPGESAPDIVIMPYDGEEEINTMLRQVLTQYYGVPAYQHLVEEIAESIPELEKNNAKNVLLHQNYLFAVDRGCGFTTLLSSLGDILHRFRIYPEDEYGSRTHYTEMAVGKETSNACGTVDDAIDFLRNHEDAREYNIAAFDISYFLEGNRKNDLRSFIKQLEAYQGDYVFAFRIPFLEKKALDEITDILSDTMLLKVVAVPPIHDTVVMEGIWNVINESRYTPETSIQEVALDKIHLEKMDGRFYGFKSAEKVAYEIILGKTRFDARTLAAGEEVKDAVIHGSDVEGLVDRKKQKATGYAALEELIGMEKITERIREIIAQVKVAITNEKLDRPSIHMRFTGAPGTGKTTVARIVGQIMREEGILRKGGFFEYTARDLIAEYVGQTAVKTATICRDSYGSVLFIDEAYALYDGEKQSNDYGKEAITTLVAEMENHRDDMLIVMAGYTDEMDTLMKANPGLRSRMPLLIDFPNYTKEQLFEIFMLMVRKHFDYTPELEAEAKRFFDELSDGYMASKEFANARFVRNLYERTWSKAALRASLAGKTDFVITKEDFIAASGDKEFSEKLETKHKLGF